MEKNASNVIMFVIFGIGVALGVFVTHKMSLILTHGDTSLLEYIIFFLFGGSLPILGASSIIASLDNTRCPSCGYTLVKNEKHKQTISRQKGYKTVTRERKNSQGDVISKWDEQIRVLNVDYLHTNECSHCGHEWTTTSSKEYENFQD